MSIKSAIKAVLPRSLLTIVRRHLATNPKQKYKNLTTKDIFTKIYEDGAWGKHDTQMFYSGKGSHSADITSIYIEAVQNMLSSLQKLPNVVDLGCGDFFIGSNIRSLCDSYIACDIVEPLIAFNKIKYNSINVDFRVLDITKDDLPKADIVFIRQVLQHLSNEQIANAIQKIKYNYKYLVLTEGLPRTNEFIPNIDQATGVGSRSAFDSGVVLTSPPFNLNVLEEKCLCDASDINGTIRTILYKL
jgi:SAM-dependent methyltransferase